NNDISNLACMCSFCHLNFHIGRAGMMGEAALIFCGELTQAEISHIARAVYVGINDGNVVARGGYALMSMFSAQRHTEAKRLLGTGNPTVLGTALLKLSPEEDAIRIASLLPNIRLLPLGRKIVDGIDVFEAIVKYWRSDSGPFGRVKSRDWPKFAADAIGDGFRIPDGAPKSGEAGT
ncbi:MAG: hypothetical protein ING19_08550, partial [Azospirillum sp.]|nr:hypothetical protein [Azospirillum sp.]